MAQFRYRAIAPSGELVVGSMEAPDETEVLSRLQDQSLLPVAAEPAGSARARWWDRPVFVRRSLSDKQLGAVTRQLARLARAGLPVERCLEILILVAESKGIEQTLSRILNGIRGGSTLADAFASQGPPFNATYVSMIRAGEAGSALPVVIERLSVYHERAREFRASMVSALIYPTVLVVVSLASVIVLLAFVVPQFHQLFEDSAKALPLSTTVVIWLAEKLRSFWWLPLGLVLAALMVVPWMLHVPMVRRAWHGLLLDLPLLGDIVRKIEVARFTRTLGTLLTNGVPLQNALAIAEGTLSNSVFTAAVERVSGRLTAGEGLAGPLQDAEVFPPLAVQMVRVGIETSRLDELLLEVAEIFDSEVRQTLKTLLAVLEPALILLLGLMVGTIIVSILLAILSVNDLAL